MPTLNVGAIMRDEDPSIRIASDAVEALHAAMESYIRRATRKAAILAKNAKPKRKTILEEDITEIFSFVHAVCQEEGF